MDKKDQEIMRLLNAALPIIKGFCLSTFVDAEKQE